MAFALQPRQILVAALAGWIGHQQEAVIDFLREENRVLKQQLGKKRLRLNDNRQHPQRERYRPRFRARQANDVEPIPQSSLGRTRGCRFLHRRGLGTAWSRHFPCLLRDRVRDTSYRDRRHHALPVVMRWSRLVEILNAASIYIIPLALRFPFDRQFRWSITAL